MSHLTIQKLSKYLPSENNSRIELFNQLNLSLEKSQLGCLLGESGAGKSTLLRCIAGLEFIDSGHIELAGQVFNDKNKHLPAFKRGIAMVFQEPSLLPHLTVAENIAFALKSPLNQLNQSIKLIKNELTQTIAELLNLIEMPGYEKRYPHELSGGQQQRVAIARAIAPKPSLLLLDEPFSSLDIHLSKQLAKLIKNLLKHQNTTALMVTHDIEQALAIADCMGVLQNGNIGQWATPYEIYHQPNTPSLAKFIAPSYFLPAKCLEKFTLSKDSRLQQAWQTELGIVRSYQQYSFSKGYVLIRPEHIHEDANSSTQAYIESKTFLGAYYLLQIRLASGQIMQMHLPVSRPYNVGDVIAISVRGHAVSVFENL